MADSGADLVGNVFVFVILTLSAAGFRTQESMLVVRRLSPWVIHVADFGIVSCMCDSRFDRWDVLVGSGAASSGRFRPIWGVREVRAGIQNMYLLVASKRPPRTGCFTAPPGNLPVWTSSLPGR